MTDQSRIARQGDVPGLTARGLMSGAAAYGQVTSQGDTDTMARNTYIPPASQATYAAELALQSLIRDLRGNHRMEQRHRTRGMWLTRWQMRWAAKDAIRALRAVRVAAVALGERAS